MKASRFTEAQIITILREAETGTTTIEAVCRKHAIAQATFYRWRNTYGGVDASEAARLKELERENARLKKLFAERDLEIEIMKEINAKKGRRTGSSRPGPLCLPAWFVESPSVCAAPGGAFHPQLSQHDASAGSGTR